MIKRVIGYFATLNDNNAKTCQKKKKKRIDARSKQFGDIVQVKPIQ
jgi:hypothetical protein